MEVEQFGIIKNLLTEIRDLLKEQKQTQSKQLLLEETKFGSNIDEPNRCACGKLPHELCDREFSSNVGWVCMRNIGKTF